MRNTTHTGDNDVNELSYYSIAKIFTCKHPKHHDPDKAKMSPQRLAHT